METKKNKIKKKNTGLVLLILNKEEELTGISGCYMDSCQNPLKFKFSKWITLRPIIYYTECWVPRWLKY